MMVMVVVVDTPAPDQPPDVKPNDDEMRVPAPVEVLIEIKSGEAPAPARVKP